MTCSPDEYCLADSGMHIYGQSWTKWVAPWSIPSLPVLARLTMRVPTAIFVFVLSCVLQAFSLRLRWPGPIHENELVTFEFWDGRPPYTAGVAQYPDILLYTTSTSQPTGGFATWQVNVTKGTRIMFAVVDATGAEGGVGSGWVTVQEDLAVMSSSMSVASNALQSSMSALSTSAQRPTSTPTSAPSSQTPASIPVGPLVGGIVGGVAALLVLALLAFWLIRQSKAPNAPVVLPTVNPGYNSPMDKDAATLASSHLPSTPYRPTPAAPTHTTTYGGYPEIQNARQ